MKKRAFTRAKCSFNSNGNFSFLNLHGNEEFFKGFLSRIKIMLKEFRIKLKNCLLWFFYVLMVCL